MAVTNPLLSAVKTGAAPRMVKLAAVSGSLPLPPEILMEIQILLVRDPDPEIKNASLAGLRNFPAAELSIILEGESASPGILDFCAGFFIQNPALVEKIILNPATSNKTIYNIAPRIAQSLVELIINNQVRLIESPEIVSALRQNPNLTPGNRQRLDEIVHDYLSGSTAVPVAPPAPPPPLEPLPPEPAFPEEPDLAGAAADLAAEAALQAEEEEDQGKGPSPQQMEYIQELAAGDEDKLTLYQRMAQLQVSEKVKLALLGKREERALLIRDANRLVATSVLCSPKLTDSEVELFSQLRNVSNEVLRMIGRNKEWTKNYRISHNLVKNPRAPLAISLSLLSRLNSMDLKNIQRDRSVPDAIRQQAKRMDTRRQGG